MNFDASFPLYLYQETTFPLSTPQQPEMTLDRKSPSANKRVASKVAPRIYLTCLATAKDAKQLSQLGITHVVSAIENAPTFPSSHHPLRTLHISISDYDGEDILSHLPATTSFIRGALAENPTNRVLVRTQLFFFFFWPIIRPRTTQLRGASVGHFGRVNLLTNVLLTVSFVFGGNRSTASWASAGVRP